MGKTTLLDIAKKVNVSKTTVSMVLNNKDISVSKETREKIVDAARELNYIPNTLARSLSTKKTYTIGVIVPDIQNPFFAEMAKAIEITAERYGYSVILCNSFDSDKKEFEYIKLLVSRLVDGVIFAASGCEGKGIDILKDNKVPFSVVDRFAESNKKFNGVFCDNKFGVELGVKYLFDKGNKNIAFVTGNSKVQVAKTRLDSYINITKELGIFDDNLIIEENFSMTGGVSATEKLIKKNKSIDAIFYSSDVMALGGIKYLLKNRYKIPQDINVLGYDNIDISSFIEPELTTIAQPIFEIGEKSCELLINLINGNDKGETVIKFKPVLIERATVR